MKRLSKRVRFISGIAAVLFSFLLSWVLADIFGDVSMILVFFGCFVFVWLNPELMRGD